MGHCIIKLTDDAADDRWMIWSSVVDAPTGWGTEADIIEWCLYYEHYSAFEVESGHALEKITEQIERARSTGSSSRMRGGGQFDDTGFVYMQQGWLPRERFGALIDRYDAVPPTEYPDVSDLLDPFEDD